MASGPKGPRPDSPGARRKRPAPPVIEGMATEIASAPVTPADDAPAADAMAPEPTAAPARETTSAPESPPTAHETTHGLEFEQPATDAATAESVAATDTPPIDAPPPPPPAEPIAHGELAFDGGDRRDGRDRSDRVRTWPVVLAAAAVALTLFVVIAGLWLAGLLTQRDNLHLAQRLERAEAQLRQFEHPSAAAPGNGKISEEAAQRLDAVQARMAGNEQALQRLDAINARLDKIEAATSAPATSAAAAPASPDAALVERLATTESAITDLRGAIAAAAKPAADAAATDKVLADRLTTLESAVKAMGDRIGSMDGAIKALTDHVGSLPARLDEIVAQARAIEQRAATADQRAEAAGKQAAAAQKSAEGAQQTQTRAAAESTRTFRLAFLANALRDAVARGEPYASELAALQPLVPDKSVLTPLEPFAATGIPGAPALARELGAAVPKQRESSGPAGRDGGMLDRLAANAERLVRIRRVDAPAGDDADATLARIEASAARGDVDAALADLQKLPPDRRAAFDAWIKKTEARRAALGAAVRLARESTTALGKE